MPLPVVTTAQLATFTGQPEQMFGIYVNEALAQASFLVEMATGVHELDPSDAYGLRLYAYSVAEIAAHLYAEQQYWTVSINPFQSESIGSYTYNKSQMSSKVSNGDYGDLMWLPLYADYLQSLDLDGAGSGIQSGQIHGSEYDGVGIAIDGDLRMLSPKRDIEFFDPYAGPYPRGW